eukprot:CAMPEP_0174888206 /NCGR_PEP_ID=MMETSP0167-20121228/3479_1 /TAXON_ID=38298 /ORGANISM="Rhodella maculata, Strain CCMP736" /LENGTH=48 /DNA_ID= /DNA_START= /DNA_END= /DNA_ORIENTATION=
MMDIKEAHHLPPAGAHLERLQPRLLRDDRGRGGLRRRRRRDAAGEVER